MGKIFSKEEERGRAATQSISTSTEYIEHKEITTSPSTENTQQTYGMDFGTQSTFVTSDEADNALHQSTSKRLGVGHGSLDDNRGEGSQQESKKLKLEMSGFPFSHEVHASYHHQVQESEQQGEEYDSNADEMAIESYSSSNWFECPDPSLIPRLPLELWNSIFSFLPTIQDRCIASMVCKEWGVMAWTPITNLELSFRYRVNQDQIVSSVISKCCSLRELILVDCYSVTGKIFQHLPSSLQRFQYKNCPNLIKTTTNNDLKDLPELIVLKLDSCMNIDDQGIFGLPRTLRDLDLSRTSITDIGLLNLPPHLKSLKLSGCLYNFQTLCTLPPTLKELDLSSSSITDKALENLPASLRHLNLSNCQQVTDNGLSYLRNLTGLRVLILENCRITDAGIDWLPKEALEVLSLRDCDITDKAISQLGKGLIDLDLWGCSSITRSGIESLPPHLTSLKLIHCNVADEWIQLLPKSLKKLSLFGCNTTDHGMSFLPEGLRELDLSWTNITDKGLQTISSRLLCLKHLNISNTHITKEGEGLIVLSNNRPDIKVLKGPGLCE